MHLYCEGELISNQELLCWRWGISRSFSFQARPKIGGSESTISHLAKLARKSSGLSLRRTLDTYTPRKGRHPTPEALQDVAIAPKSPPSPAIKSTLRRRTDEPLVRAPHSAKLSNDDIIQRVQVSPFDLQTVEPISLLGSGANAKVKSCYVNGEFGHSQPSLTPGIIRMDLCYERDRFV